MRIRDTASLLGPAARGAMRLLMESALATPRRIYIGAGVAALVAGIGANALLLQIGRHPAPLLAATHDPLPASAHTAAPAGTVEPVAPHVSPTPISDYSTASAAALPAAGESRATQASAPDITSSIEPAAQDKQHQSSASLASESERQPAALAPTRSALSCTATRRRRIASGARCPDRAREARICGQARWRRRRRHPACSSPF